MPRIDRIRSIRGEMSDALSGGILPFWLDRSIDREFGGYLTCFDAEGEPYGDGAKYLVTQCRMVWAFSALAAHVAKPRRAEAEAAARQGARFLIERMWDGERGGFYWKSNRDGSPADRSKLVYGEAFAIYALAEFHIAYRDPEALRLASATFDYVKRHASDALYGGYLENLEADGSPSPPGERAGDRKSLDIHMHLMEAFTALYRATHREVHARALREARDLIFLRMVDPEKGFGMNQFLRDFRPVPAIPIPRTWNAERESNEALGEPADTTSYGHNLELFWLTRAANAALGDPNDPLDPILRRTLAHSLRWGIDREFGGVYRDGVGDGPALVRDKEWWQNFEALVGLLEGYAAYRDEACFEAFADTWAFVRDRFLDPALGESRQLLDRAGGALVGALGNPWKGAYHTGRALLESILRLGMLSNEEAIWAANPYNH